MDLRRAGAKIQVAGLQAGHETTFQARLAVVATGASLKLLRRIGLVRHKPLMMVAARAYFEGLGEQGGHLQCHFDGVTLPGYGWVFPLSPSSANVGAGVIPAGFLRRPHPVHSRGAFHAFTRSPSLQKMMQSARQVGPLQGFPIRIDFDRALSFGDRVLLAGEAAGLANPLTGEGIDYALESGRIAAEHAAGMLSKDDMAGSRFADYDRELRGRFQRTIVDARRLGDLYLNPFLLNRMVKVARRNPDIGSLIGDVTVGNRGLNEMLSIKTLFRFALAV
jgi:flavin-dependent dehydrogenase